MKTTEQNIATYIDALYAKGRRLTYQCFSVREEEVLTKLEAQTLVGLLIERDQEREGGSIFSLLRSKGADEFLGSAAKWLINNDFFALSRVTLNLENLLLQAYKSEINRLLDEKDSTMAHYFNESIRAA